VGQPPAGRSAGTTPLKPKEGLNGAPGASQPKSPALRFAIRTGHPQAAYSLPHSGCYLHWMELAEALQDAFLYSRRGTC
jgi:hypothetical protein